MRESENTDYSSFKILGSIAVLGASFVTANAHVTVPIENSFISSYAKYGDYASSKLSTSDDSIVKNDVYMLKLLEIAEINKKIKISFDTEIVEHWIPADGLLNKTCLFVRVKEQEKFVSKNDYDFELELYLQIQEEIKNSNFFNMIALL